MIDFTLADKDGFYDIAIPVKIQNDIRSRIILSLFTDAEVQGQSGGGWWGGDNIGSQIWTSDRSKVTQDEMNNIIESAELALTWLTDENIASSFSVDAQKLEGDKIELTISINLNNEEVMTQEIII